MTDNEIIKALECCGKSDECDGANCPYYNVPYSDEKTCEGMVMYDALDLINRQNVYIETLKERNLIQKYKEVPLGNEVVYRIGWENAIVEAIKTEAYKEFAERLITRIYKGGPHPTVEDEFMIEIDNLVKELTE